MAIRVEKKAEMTLMDLIVYQLLTHCYLEKIIISRADMECLAALILQGEQEIGDFCHYITEKEIFQSIQTVRNVLTKLEKKGLILKDGKSKKKIQINPALSHIQSRGTILLDYKFLYRDAA